MCFANKTLLLLLCALLFFPAIFSSAKEQEDPTSTQISTPDTITTTTEDPVEDPLRDENATDPTPPNLHHDENEELGAEYVTEDIPTDQQLLSPTKALKPKPTVTVTATRIGSTRYFTSENYSGPEKSQSSSNAPHLTIMAVPYVPENGTLATTTSNPLHEPLITTVAPIVTQLPNRNNEEGDDNEEDYVKEWDDMFNEPPDNGLHHEILPEPEPLVSPAKSNEEDELAEALNHNKESKPELRRHRKRKRRLRGRTSNVTMSIFADRNGYPSTIERSYNSANTPKPFIPRMRMTRRFRSTTPGTTSTTTMNPNEDRASMPMISNLAITEVSPPKFSSTIKQPILLQSPLISSFKTPATSDDDLVTAEPQIEKSAPRPYTESVPSRGATEAEALSAVAGPPVTPHNNETGEWLHSDHSRQSDVHHGGFYPLDRVAWEKNYMNLQQHSFDSPSEEQDEEETPIITLEDLYRQARNNSGMIQMSQPEREVTVIEHHHMHPPGTFSGTPLPPTYAKDDVSETQTRSAYGQSPTHHHHSQSYGQPQPPEEQHIFMIEEGKEPESQNNMHHYNTRENQAVSPYESHTSSPYSPAEGESMSRYSTPESQNLSPYNTYTSANELKWAPSLTPTGSHYDGTKGKSVELEITKAIVDGNELEKPMILSELGGLPSNGMMAEIEYFKEDDTIPPLMKPVLTKSPPSSPLPPEYYSPKSNHFNSPVPPSPDTIYTPEVHFVDVLTGTEINEPIIKYKAEPETRGGYLHNNKEHFQSIPHPTYVSPAPPVREVIPTQESYFHFSADDSRNTPPALASSPTSVSSSSDSGKKEEDPSVVEIHHHHFPDGSSYAIRQPTSKTQSEEKLREDAEVVMGTHWGLSHQHFVPSSRTGLPQSQQDQQQQQGTRNPKNLFKGSKPVASPSRPPPPTRDFSRPKSSRFTDPNLHASSSLTLPMPGLVSIPTPPTERHALKEVTPHQHFPPHSHSIQHQSDYEPANPPLPTAHAFDQHFDHFMQNAGHFRDSNAHHSEGSKSQDFFSQSFVDPTYGDRNNPRKTKKSKSKASSTSHLPSSTATSDNSDFFNNGPPSSYHKDFIPSHPDYGNNNIVLFDDHTFEPPQPTVSSADYPNYTKTKSYSPESDFNMENHGPPIHTVGGGYDHHIANNNADSNNNKNNAGGKNAGVKEQTNNIQDLLKQLANSDDDKDQADEVSPYSETPYILMFHSAVKPKAKPTQPPPILSHGPIVLPFTSKDKLPAASNSPTGGSSPETILGPGMTVVPVHPRQQMLKVLATKQYLKKLEAVRERQNRPPPAIFTPYGVLVPMAASPESISQAGSSPPKLTTLLNAHHAAQQQLKGDKTKASASTTDEKSLLRALLGSKSHSDAIKKAKATSMGTKTLETLLDTLAEKLATKLTGGHGGQYSSKQQEDHRHIPNDKFHDRGMEGFMNEGSYSELRPVVTTLNKQQLSQSPTHKNVSSSGENPLSSAAGKSPAKRKEPYKVPPAMPSQYFKSLLKERLVEMLEDKTEESSAMMGTSTKGFSLLANSGSHPFARRREKFPVVNPTAMKTARKSGSGATLLTSASKFVPILAPTSNNMIITPQKKQEPPGGGGQSQRARLFNPAGGILSAIKRFFSFGRADPGLRKHSANVTMLENRMRKRTGELGEKSMMASVVITTKPPFSYLPLTGINNGKAVGDSEGSRPLHLKYGFKTAGEFETTLKELLKAKRAAAEGKQGKEISSEKLTIYSKENNLQEGGLVPAMVRDRMKLVPDHAFMSTSTSYFKSPSPSWAKSMPINVIPSPFSPNGNGKNGDSFHLIPTQTASGKLPPVISKWKPISESTSFLSPFSTNNNKSTKTNSTAPSYSPVFKVSPPSSLWSGKQTPATEKSEPALAAKNSSSHGEHLIRPRSVGA